MGDIECEPVAPEHAADTSALSLSSEKEMRRALDRHSRLCLKSPSSARLPLGGDRTFFRLARTAKQAILNVSSIQPDVVQTENKPVEARSTFQTEPRVKGE